MRRVGRKTYQWLSVARHEVGKWIRVFECVATLHIDTKEHRNLINNGE